LVVRETLMVLAVVGLVLVVIAAEIIAAVLPILIVITLVPPEERPALAELLAAADSSRRLRLWTALRVAVKARRTERRTRRAGCPERQEAGLPQR
jgi:putative exporter of polyketide antibiotics